MKGKKDYKCKLENRCNKLFINSKKTKLREKKAQNEEKSLRYRP